MKKYKVSIKSSSSYLPPKVVTNFDIVEKIDTSDEWIYKKLGIKERRVAENESVSEMGYKVAVSAISNANINKEDIDMIIVATSSPEKNITINRVYNS
jgi:3-oxoacyl-[acyl-carrier-protein] synthase III